MPPWYRPRTAIAIPVIIIAIWYFFAYQRNHHFQLRPTGQRCRVPCAQKNISRKLFVPVAKKYLNQWGQHLFFFKRANSANSTLYPAFSDSVVNVEYLVVFIAAPFNLNWLYWPTMCTFTRNLLVRNGFTLSSVYSERGQRKRKWRMKDKGIKNEG